MRGGAWDRRGLVVGHVQSGKTSNYTGLICKAADAGYRIIIVLAGIHNNLRSQTQMRLDEGFLGYETSPTREDSRTVTGVGLIDPSPDFRPDYFTNRADNGDFKTTFARQFGVALGNRPALFVIKKNKTVLERLLGWLQKQSATQLPLLVIDDEADHASVDTGDQFEAGSANPDHEPTAINRLIRRLLLAFPKSAFVGYTATPFANVFIHDQGYTETEGDDLFPRSFIMNLPGPSNYAGPVRLFGLGSEGDAQDGRKPGLPLTREVTDYAASLADDEKNGWMPPKHKSSHKPLVNGQKGIPDSLKEAIHAFLLTCAVRQLRKQGGQHCSMLIHVSRFTAVQNEVQQEVAAYVKDVQRRLRRKVSDFDLIESLKALWFSDFIPTSQAVHEAGAQEAIPLPSWDDLAAVLPVLIEDIKVKTINGTAKDALDYVEHEGTGLKVIAVGGDKLARGLTLEGLTVSYFLRASRMYDTLMQMGRWFGYRPRYLDLCRLYTTGELISWFQHITKASEELREAFDHMYATGGTPKEYGLRIQSHPVLLVTSRVKMRTARKLELSYSGESVETTVLFRNPQVLQKIMMPQ